MNMSTFMKNLYGTINYLDIIKQHQTFIKFHDYPFDEEKLKEKEAIAKWYTYIKSPEFQPVKLFG